MMSDSPVTGSPPAASAADLDRDLPGLDDTSVLIVDDNLQNLELLQAYLEELPCAVRTATDGLEAMDAIEQHDVDLVLLDVMMPRMSGFEVCQKIKTSPATRDTVVIMVTALHEVGDFERAIESGTDDFLTKPINKLELLTRVRSLLRVRILRRKMDQLLQLRASSGLGERDHPSSLGEPDDPPPAH